MGRRSKRLRTIGAEGKDSVKKNVEAKKGASALVRKEEIGGIECAGSTSASVSGGEKNVKRTIEEKEMATTKTEGTEKAMECDVQTTGEDNSEGKIVSEEEKENSRRMSSSSASSEISESERVRKKIRDRNLTNYRMVRTRQEMDEIRGGSY